METMRRGLKIPWEEGEVLSKETPSTPKKLATRPPRSLQDKGRGGEMETGRRGMKRVVNGLEI